MTEIEEVKYKKEISEKIDLDQVGLCLTEFHDKS